MAKISVIVPIYNAEKYLGATLACLTRQTYKDLEIICVLDCPTDSSEKIAEEFATDERVKIVRHEKNSGLPASRNTGVAAATGEYIHFIDSDDIVSPDFYENMLAAAEIQNSDVTACNVFYEKKPWRSIWYEKTEVATTKKDKFKKSRVLIHGWSWRYLIRRSFWNEHNLSFPNLVPLEDKPAMVPMIYYANSVALCHDAVLLYKYRPASILNAKYDAEKEKRRSENRQKARQIVKDFMRKHKIKRPSLIEQIFG